MPLKVEFGIPEPDENWQADEMPAFRQKGITSVRLDDFPPNVLPSGGMSNRISESEMLMVHTCIPVEHIWKNEKGKILAHLSGARYSFIGRFSWEITEPGMFYCYLSAKGKEYGFVEFEVI